MKRKILSVVLVVLSLCAAGWTGYSQRASRVQWEYNVYAGKDVKELDRFGAEGWELVSVDVPSGIFFFKRPK